MFKTTLEVYSSGVPNFFTYGICTITHNTYSLIDNQYWVRASTNFTDIELSSMHFIAVQPECYVKD